MRERDGDKDERIRVTTGSLKLPEGVTNESAGREMNRVIMVVVAIAVAFIVFIAYLISKAG